MHPELGSLSCHSNPFQVATAAQQSLSLVMCDIVPSILARNIVQH